MKKALILLATGFEETEAVTIIDVLRRGKIAITSASLDQKLVEGAHAIHVKADVVIDQITEQLFDAVIMPGGMGGTENLLASKKVQSMLIKHADAGKIVSAICAAPMVLEQAQLLKEKKATIYPGLEDKLVSASELSTSKVVTDGNIITSKGPATAMQFALTLVETLAGTDMAKEVAAGLLFEE